MGCLGRLLCVWRPFTPNTEVRSGERSKFRSELVPRRNAAVLTISLCAVTLRRSNNKKLRKRGARCARRATYSAAWHHGAGALCCSAHSPQNWLCSQQTGSARNPSGAMPCGRKAPVKLAAHPPVRRPPPGLLERRRPNSHRTVQ